MRELKIAKSIALLAGRLLMEERGKNLEIRIKEDHSPNTRVDRLSSGFITGELQRYFPGYGIIDEESLPTRVGRETDCIWVVDPLESTISYLRDEDTFGVMIGLLKDYKPVLGVTYRPKIDELVYAASGAGAYSLSRGESRRLRVNDSQEIDLLISRFRRDPKLEELINCLKPERVREMASSFKTVEVAKGNATLFISPKTITLNIWDLCAPQVILEGAGGRLTDLYGNPIDYKADLTNRYGVVASNRSLHQEIIACTSEIFK